MMKTVFKLLIIFLISANLHLWAQGGEGDSARSVKVVHYQMKADRNTTPSVDHSKFAILKEEFADAHQVTAACLSCHTNRDKEIMATSHWKWEREEEIPGKGKVKLGKKNILNNFCIGTRSNEGTCTRCHIGYGWEDKNFDFTDPLNIDCLVCHDKTGTYQKEKGEAGYPKKSVNLNYVAQHVGEPGRENCGVCHFWGGGGNNVKHGDLEISLLDAKREVDVHMTTEGEDMSCVDCHVTEKHEMTGKLYALSSENKDRASCEYCHTEAPHTETTLNVHCNRIACQTCHIPTYAKVNGTKMIWDWSTAGKLDEHGNPVHENDADGNHNYLSIKGNFVYDDNVIPEYYWFNGIAGHQLIEDKIEEVPVQMNTLYGSYMDRGQDGGAVSKIWPVKVHRGKQPYDTVYKTLIQAKTWDKEPGKGAYWTDFDWQEANRLGMEYVGLPYSGHFDFVETEMYWPLNHMVSPANQSLKCIDCHTRGSKGRLANLTDFYLPGRDVNMTVETAGVSFILASIIGIGFHTFCRIFFKGKCIANIREEEDEL
jgi:octaheme c-type cytochrome (tetrathionate reductase family)